MPDLLEVTPILTVRSADLLLAMAKLVGAAEDSIEEKAKPEKNEMMTELVTAWLIFADSSYVWLPMVFPK